MAGVTGPPPAGRGLAAAALLFNAFTWGVSWWPMRQLAAAGLHPLWVTSLAFSVAVALLLLARPGALGLLWRERALWVLMLGAGATNACFNWAVTIGDVVRVVLLFYLMPLWTMLLARALLGERISRRGGVRLAMSLAGAAVVLWPGGPSAPPLPGARLADALALLGGFSFALNNVMLRREAHQDAGARALAMFAGGVLVAGGLALLLHHGGQLAAPPPPAWPWLLGTAALALWFLGSNLALQYGAARLPANTTSVVMVTEVAFASLSAVALGAGLLDARTTFGAVLIVSAAVLASLQKD